MSGLPDVLSIRELRRRLMLLDRATEHLKPASMMNPDNPWSREVTLHDIAVFVGIGTGKAGKSWGKSLRMLVREDAPASCRLDCRVMSVCQKQPQCRNIYPALQRQLSECLRGIDAGTIRKVRQAKGWRLVEFPKHPAHSPLAQMAAAAWPAPETRSIKGTIELTPGGPRLKLP